MTETKTVELPLTKSEQRHLDNTRRQAEKRKRGAVRRESVEARDAKLKEINDGYLPRIRELRTQHREAIKKVWDEWRDERSKVA